MTQMKSRLVIPAAIALMGVSSTAWTADDDGAEATIRLMGTAEAEAPESVTKTISLPAHLIDSDDQVAAVEKARKAHDLANANVHRDKTLTGQDRAAEAREQGKDLAEKAKEARENRGRSDPPGRPEDPGRPDNPGGR